MEAKDEIKQRLDIAEVIGEYLEVKPAGSGSFKALCPFHGEKTPSFYISQPKEIWHCFGCDKGGDIFTFVMEMEGIGFRDALKQLGKKAGVEIPEYRTAQSNAVDFIVDLHRLAADFYMKVLWEHDLGKQAKAYVEQRGISVDMAKKFEIGYAPDSWDSLTRALKKRGFTEDRLVKAGLAKPRRSGSGVIDQFRHRLVIPLRDAQGNIVGFTGRQIEDGKGPKYLNTPETDAYHKSDILFGLAFAKSSIRKQDAVIIAEGNLDVIASHAAGVEHIVASSGTALTESQLLQLKKLTKTLLFCFDDDAAGFAAAQRGMHIAQGLGFDVQVIQIPSDLGKDPDDVVRWSPHAWSDLVKKPVHVMQYIITHLLKTTDLQNAKQKREFGHRVLQEINRLPDILDQEHWLQRLSDLMQVDISVLRQLVRPSKTVQSIVRQAPTGEEKKVLTQDQQAFDVIMSAMLLDAEWIEYVMSRLDIDGLEDEMRQEVYKKALVLYNQSNHADSAQNIFSGLEHAFDDQEAIRQYLRRMSLQSEQRFDSLSNEQVRRELEHHIDIIHVRVLDKRRKSLLAQIREAERQGNQSELQRLLQEYNNTLK